MIGAPLTKIYPSFPTSVQPISTTKTLLIVPTKNERDPPLFTGKLLIKFQNILRNTTQVIIRHRVKILFPPLDFWTLVFSWNGDSVFDFYENIVSYTIKTIESFPYQQGQIKLILIFSSSAIKILICNFISFIEFLQTCHKNV
jgi:hypothetical protein